MPNDNVKSEVSKTDMSQLLDYLSAQVEHANTISNRLNGHANKLKGRVIPAGKVSAAEDSTPDNGIIKLLDTLDGIV